VPLARVVHQPPALVVVNIVPLVPTTVHTAVVAQLMPLSIALEPLESRVQVVPPSVVLRMVPPSPTAKHTDALGQLIALR